MTNLARLVRWLAAHDEIDTAVLHCPHTERPKVARRCLSIRWDDCLANVDVRPLAVLLANGCNYLQVYACPERELPSNAWQSALGDLIGPYEEVNRIGQGEGLDMASVPFPRRQLFAVTGIGEKDDQDLAYEAFHELVTQQAIPLPEMTAEERLHAMRCPCCSAHASDCKVSWLTDEGWLESCLACRVSVHYCAEFSDDETKREDEIGLSLLEAFEARKERPQAKCVECGNLHPKSEGELCALCKWRREHPFEATMPPEVLEKLPEALRKRLGG